jgi:cytochrome c biogenesis protein CcmG/thiol:disulfide interchange protein DsbE
VRGPAPAGADETAAAKRTKRLLYVIPLVAVGLLVAYFGFGLTRDPSLLPSVLIDKPFPQMDLPPIAEYPKGFATADLAGQVALVNIFASWCVACKVEHPLLMELKQQGSVPIYGIAWKDDPVASTTWLRQRGDPYTLIGADRSGRAAIDLGVTGAPETFVVDKAGRIRYKHIGPIMPEDWTDLLQPLLTQLAAE